MYQTWPLFIIEKLKDIYHNNKSAFQVLVDRDIVVCICSAGDGTPDSPLIHLKGEFLATKLLEQRK